MTNILVLDLETSIKNRGTTAIGTQKASPFHVDNHICLYAWQWINNTSPEGEGIFTSVPSPTDLSCMWTAPTLLVGHNIKFDLLYLYKQDPDFWREWARTGQLWDTMFAEYLLSGAEFNMKNRTLNLDAVATRYGGTTKDKRLEEMWESNIDTEDIDLAILEPYAKKDIENTTLIFLKQIEEAKKRGVVEWVLCQMDDLLASTEMEWNGMHFSKHKALTYRTGLVEKAQEKFEDIKSYMLTKGVVDPNPNSSAQLGAVLFGGELSYVDDVVILDDNGNKVLYKSGEKKGQVKTRKEKIAYSLKGELEIDHPDKSTSEDRLKPYALTSPFVECLLEYRELQKDISTYYDGYLKHLWPDSKLHPRYNHCITPTGRQTCSQPNLQNVTATNKD